jgi:hypothetical protein
MPAPFTGARSRRVRQYKLNGQSSSKANRVESFVPEHSPASQDPEHSPASQDQARNCPHRSNLRKTLAGDAEGMLAELSQAQHNLHGLLRLRASQEKPVVAGRLMPAGLLLHRLQDSLCLEEGSRFRQPSRRQRSNLLHNSRRRAIVTRVADGMPAELSRACLRGLRLRPQASQEKPVVAGRLTPEGLLLRRLQDNLCLEEGTRFRQPSRLQRSSLQCNSRRRAIVTRVADGMPAELSRARLRGLHLRPQASQEQRLIAEHLTLATDPLPQRRNSLQ